MTTHERTHARARARESSTEACADRSDGAVPGAAGVNGSALEVNCTLTELDLSSNNLDRIAVERPRAECFRKETVIVIVVVVVVAAVLASRCLTAPRARRRCGARADAGGAQQLCAAATECG